MTKDNILLSLNQQQFDTLLRIFYLGKWMLESNEDNYDTVFKREQELEQFLYAHADSKSIEFSSDLGLFHPTTKVRGRNANDN